MRHDVPRYAASFVSATESRSFVMCPPLRSVQLHPPAIFLHTPLPSECLLGGVASTKPQYRRSPTKVIHKVEPSSLKKRRVSFVNRVAVPLLFPELTKDLVSLFHFPARASGYLSALELPKPNLMIPFFKHSFSHPPFLPSLI